MVPDSATIQSLAETLLNMSRGLRRPEVSSAGVLSGVTVRGMVLEFRRHYAMRALAIKLAAIVGWEFTKKLWRLYQARVAALRQAILSDLDRVPAHRVPLLTQHLVLTGLQFNHDRLFFIPNTCKNPEQRTSQPERLVWPSTRLCRKRVMATFEPGAASALKESIAQWVRSFGKEPSPK